MRKTLTLGFTILEVLISLFLLAFILVGAGQLLSNSSTLTRDLTAQTDLQEELRSAAGIITEEIQRAYYVFPPQNSQIKTGDGAFITANWSTFNLMGPSGASSLKTGIHNSSTFSVNTPGSGANPQILAMITSPRDPDVPCLSTKGTTTVYEGGEGCYQFIVYYVVLRPNVTRGLAGNNTTSSELLEVDSANSGRFVLMEFRMNLTAKLTTGGTITDWGEVGCEHRGDPATPPKHPLAIPGPKCTTVVTTTDPSPLTQNLDNSLPALSCIGFCNTTILTRLPVAGDANRFAQRMTATVNWINANSASIPVAILADYVDDSLTAGNRGFSISMPDTTFDARGVFQVRVSLKGKVSIDGKLQTFPATPISVFAIPRNITPLL